MKPDGTVQEKANYWLIIMYQNIKLEMRGKMLRKEWLEFRELFIKEVKKIKPELLNG